MTIMKGLKADLIAQNFKMLHTNATGLPILTNLPSIISVTVSSQLVPKSTRTLVNSYPFLVNSYLPQVNSYLSKKTWQGRA